MENQVTLSELNERMIGEMERLQFSKLTIAAYNNNYRKIYRYITEETGDEIFTEELGAKYLKQTYSYPSENNSQKVNSTTYSAIHCVRRLGEMKQYGAFIRNRRTNIGYDWAGSDINLVESFYMSMQRADNSERTKELQLRFIRLFYNFIGFRGISGINSVNAKIISDYATSLHGFSPVDVKRRLATLKRYLKFLNKNNYCETDWSYSVPSVLAPKNLNVPALWSKDEIECLLKSVDRSNPIGKRNYAVLLLVIQLGIRITDIANLKFEDLKWDRKEIDFRTNKTQKRGVFPLLEDTGWAIIDYMRYARPKIDSPYVFLTHNAPYKELHISGVSNILGRQMQQCGIKKQKGVSSGMHSLRHALARRLLEQGTPLPTVANIMVHTDYTSTSPYLKVNISGLRDCSLSLAEVLSND